MKIKAGDTDFNFAHAEELLCRAAKSADVLVLPELWNTGFFPKENISLLADKNALRAKSLLSSVASRFGVCIIGGSVTEEKDGRIYNTCYIYNEKGECICSYSKTHLFSYMGEQHYFTPGESRADFTVCGIKASVVICYDMRFPEIVRKAAVDGAQLLFAVCQWPTERIGLLHILASGRAAENQMYVAVCNSCGESFGSLFGGQSAVFDPMGNKTACAGEEEEIISEDIDIGKVSSLREQFNVFGDRRTELY